DRVETICGDERGGGRSLKKRPYAGILSTGEDYVDIPRALRQAHRLEELKDSLSLTQQAIDENQLAVGGKAERFSRFGFADRGEGFTWIGQVLDLGELSSAPGADIMHQSGINGKKLFETRLPQQAAKESCADAASCAPVCDDADLGVVKLGTHGNADPWSPAERRPGNR